MQERLNLILKELGAISPQCKIIAEQVRTAPTAKMKLSFARSLDIQDPEQERLVQGIVDLLETPPLSGGEEQKVRREMQEKQVEITSPEQEAEWEKRLDEARKADLKKFKKEEVEETEETTSLDDIKGLGKASVIKLKEADINTPEEFRALSHAQKVVIIGPLVATKFK